MSGEREYPGDPFPPEDRERLASLLERLSAVIPNGPNVLACLEVAEEIRKLPVRRNPAIEADCESRKGAHDLSCWFGLSYASFCILPRVLMEAMPDEWQGKMAALLNEYGQRYTFRNTPTMTTAVSFRNADGQFMDAPRELCNYRRPDRAALEKYR